MYLLLVVCCCILSINGQREADHPAPEPYDFRFSSPNEDGSSSSREETGDANGRIVGSYTLLGADGQNRRVEYVADENGFRAKVITNEIGTESRSAADADFESSAPTAAQLVAEWEASGAGRARLQGARPIIAAAPIAPVIAVRKPALLASPIGPIGGGIAGAQGLRIGSGIRIGGAVAAPLPLKPLAVRVAAPLPAAIPAPAFGGVRIGSALASPLLSRQFVETQAFGPVSGGLGVIGAGVAPIGLQVAPIGVGLGLASPYGQQFSVGVNPLGTGGSIQQLQAVRVVGEPYAGVRHLQGLRVGGLGAGGNHLYVPNNALHNQYFSGISEQKLLETESVRNEGYGRKSK